MTVGVVEQLEIVDIEDHQRQRVLIALAAVHFLAQALRKMAGVVKAGHAVGDRLYAVALFALPKMFLRTLLLGHILERFNGTDHVTVGITQGGGCEIEPATAAAKIGKEVLCFKTTFHNL